MENMKHGTSFAITRLQIAKNTMPILKLKSQHSHCLAIRIRADGSFTQPAICCSIGIEALTWVNFQPEERGGKRRRREIWRYDLGLQVLDKTTEG